MHDDAAQSARRFYAVSADEDEPTVGRGTLIPHAAPPPVPPPREHRPRWRLTLATVKLVVPALSLLILTAFMSSLGYATLAGTASVAAPLIVVEHPYTKERMPLNYGVEVALAQPGFYAETQDALLAAARTFLDVDLAGRQLRLFEDGVLTESAPILATPPAGSWCETPAGLYEVEAKEAQHRSVVGGVVQPWRLAFAGSFAIHGWPQASDGTPASDASGGCITLADEDATRFFDAVAVGTPVLVYVPSAPADDFRYAAKVPELDTPHYLLADLESQTVLAASDLDAVAPIASLTKLMTALVAAEQLDLDASVWVSNPSFVQSLIPRLGERNRASVYSLLELLLVESSNEAAEVLAAQLGRERFVTLMNEEAAALGLTHTQFADPSGLSSDNVSSVGDLLRLTQHLFDHRRFLFDLTASTGQTSPYLGGEFGALVNFNRVADLDSFVGGKVGETRAAGQTSVTLHRATIKGEERTLVIILLGSTARNDDVATLLTYATERFGD